MRALGIGKRGPIWPVMGGSGEGSNPGTGSGPDAPEGNVDGNEAGAGESFAPITSKVDLDAAIQAAVAAAIAPFADYADVKTRAAKFDQAEAEKLPELERERQRADAAELAAAELRSQNARHAVAEATTVPADLLAGPAGTDDAALKAYAAKVIAWRGTRPGMRPNPQQGQPSESTNAQTLSSGRDRFEARRKK
ncbi:hypothetical protein [Nocardia colli]|uniref:hypothetical protein n=1 Tax=Nocardia colli TaxID=2545717 RepID=UPI0035DB0AA3